MNDSGVGVVDLKEFRDCLLAFAGAGVDTTARLALGQEREKSFDCFRPAR